MTKDYEERKANPKEYPWFVYFQYGWHTMTFLSDTEVEEAKKFYHLHQNGEAWERCGRQPIIILPRGDKNDLRKSI